MKKKILAIMLALGIGITGFGSIVLVGQTKEMESIVEDLDYSYFTVENSLIGHMNSQTRGVYLASGDSSISKISSYKVGVAGSTTAAIRCEVSVTAILERYNLETDRWGFIDSWTQENSNAFTAGISKSVIVDSGYYYRVRSLHYAGTDASSSCTNALYVGN